jgi:hypothetical protein
MFVSSFKFGSGIWDKLAIVVVVSSSKKFLAFAACPKLGIVRGIGKKERV